MLHHDIVATFMEVHKWFEKEISQTLTRNNFLSFIWETTVNNVGQTHCTSLPHNLAILSEESINRCLYLNDSFKKCFIKWVNQIGFKALCNIAKHLYMKHETLGFLIRVGYL